jgi:hypothetical protein
VNNKKLTRITVKGAGHDRIKRSCFCGRLNFKALSHLKVLKLKNTVGIRKIIEKRHAILSIPGQPSSY